MMSPIKIVTLEEAIKQVEDQIYVAKTSLPKWEKELEELKREYEEHNWMNTSHEKNFNGLKIESNYSSWENAKFNYKRSPQVGSFYFTDTNDLNEDGITVENAKELIKYLQQKIDYLEGE